MGFVKELITVFFLIFGACVLLGGLFMGIRKAIRTQRTPKAPWQIWVRESQNSKERR